MSVSDHEQVTGQFGCYGVQIAGHIVREVASHKMRPTNTSLHTHHSLLFAIHYSLSCLALALSTSSPRQARIVALIINQRVAVVFIVKKHHLPHKKRMVSQRHFFHEIGNEMGICFAD